MTPVAAGFSALQLVLTPPWKIPCEFLAFGLELILWMYVIRRAYRTTVLHSAAGVGFLLVSQAVVVAAALLLVRPFLLKAYTLPTFSMAPTLRSPYRILKCPNCNGQLLVPILEARDDVPVTQEGICADCLRASAVPTAEIVGPVLPSDRFLVAKFLSPQRWDIVAFRFTGDIYVKRLAALPGETVSIDDEGQLSINGTPCGAPPDLPTLRFRWPDGLEHYSGDRSLRPGASLRLGPDEYFVLGDNSTRALDSRFFGPIHRADILGVSTLIYWPPDRMKILR
jgi:signal peptidase I